MTSIAHPSRRAARLLLFSPAISALLLLGVPDAAAQSLRGSRASLDWQNREARNHDFTFLGEPRQLTRFVSAGLLVPLEGNENYSLNGVSYEVARPEVRLFVERLSAQYRKACGQQLIVTSLTRPLSAQPPNASPRSVHPTGMAVDLRRPSNARCRRWLESTLLSLERQKVLDATLEQRPPHYHVAVFPAEYVAYVARITRRTTAQVMQEASAAGE